MRPGRGSAPGSSTDFFLKYILNKNGVDPNSIGVIGVGLGATAIASMEQGEIEAAIMLDPAVTQLQGRAYCIAHAASPGYETYRTGWHSLILQAL